MDLRPAASGQESEPLYGISEWQCWYGHYDITEFDPETVIDDCVDAHLEAGFNHLVWNAGRSTVTYESELPHTTRLYERSGPNANAATRTVAEGAASLTDEQREDTGEVGLDWHSFRRGLYGVGTSVEPQHAL
jgi:hypothetical protein